MVSALYYDGYQNSDADEAFQLRNVSGAEVDLRGWEVTDNEETAVFPALVLSPGQEIWCARRASDFRQVFGFEPDCEYAADTAASVPDLTGSAPRFANDGDELVLYDAAGALIDALVYEGGETSQAGWSGLAVTPYQPSDFAEEGQVLYRKLDQRSGQPVPDTDTAADWAQEPNDVIDGRKVRYPGWDLERFFQTNPVTETARLTVMVAPDNVFEGVRSEILTARQSLYVEGYTFENAALGELVAAKAASGVEVKMLLEGRPAFEGIEDQERWILEAIEDAGGRVYFMVSDRNGAQDRYSYQHAKFIIVDDRVLLVGSENLNDTGMPSDDKEDGTQGHRGVWMATDAPSVVARARAIFDADLDAAHHRDIYRWTEDDPKYGAPPIGFTPVYTSGGSLYPVQKAEALNLDGTFTFELISSPESSLRTQDSLLGLVAKAGPGDAVYVEQLYERRHWGEVHGNPATDPNPRLEAYIDAARRGAEVKILLDGYFDSPWEPRSNRATRTYANRIAAAGELDLEVRLGNPTGEGIHNKMVLARLDSVGWIHVGSLNGSETSAKANRELALQVQSDGAYAYLSDVFRYDWAASKPKAVYLPLVARGAGSANTGVTSRTN